MQWPLTPKASCPGNSLIALVAEQPMVEFLPLPGLLQPQRLSLFPPNHS